MIQIMTSGDHIPQPEPAPFTVMDLFAGCGGFSEGFRSYTAGVEGLPRFRTVAAVEFDRDAAATFKANHRPDLLFEGDIADFAPDPFAGVDVITGGPPCQGFSGLRRGSSNDPRNTLWKEYLRIVTLVRPKVFIMENVDRFAASHELQLLKEEAQPGGLLSDYHLHAKVLNAADFGVPQSRRRTIVIGSHRALGNPVHHPVPTHTKPLIAASGRALFEGQEVLAPWTAVDGVFQLTATVQITGTQLPEGRDSHGVPGPYRTPELHIGRTPTQLSLARYAAIPPGGNRRDLTGKWTKDGTYLSTTSWDNHRSGSADVMGRLRLGRPSVTIRTEFFKPEKGRYLHPTEHRPITHYEAALLQDFPEDYQWYGTKLGIARQIGNAVPIGLGRALAGAIHERLSATTSGHGR